jgi:hypothetical protein
MPGAPISLFDAGTAGTGTAAPAGTEAASAAREGRLTLGANPVGRGE